MTHYIYKGEEISHNAFLGLCRRNGINPRRDQSHFEKLIELYYKGNSRAYNLLKCLIVYSEE